MSKSSQKINNYKLRKISIVKREDRYNSKYYDYQVAYRYLFQLLDEQQIESGAYLHFFGDTPVALAIDISSMVGCPMSCKFCESASIQYKRDLNIYEMIAQVTYLVEEHDKHKFPKIICSFQGIGEPSLIPHRIIEASRHFISSDHRINISISTIGFRLNAFKLWRECEIPIDNLQISCSGTTSKQIKWLMPDLPNLNKLVNEAILCTESDNIQKVKFNYVLIKDFNDSNQDVERLITLFSGTPIIVKISALNPTIASKGYKIIPGSFRRAEEICCKLKFNKVASYVYGSFNSTFVSCGQLSFIDKIDNRRI